MNTKVTRRDALRAMTLIEVLVVLAVVAVLGTLVGTSMIQAKSKSQRIDCASNLRQVGLAFRLWPKDSEDGFPMSYSTDYRGTLEVAGDVWRDFLVMSNELQTPKVLVCAADKDRIAANNWSELHNSNISYFIGLDANDATPQMWLAGDSNLEVDGKPVGPGILNPSSHKTMGWTAARHNRCGNVAMADGSVQQFDNLSLRGISKESEKVTNRLAIP
jgi:prepilin-type N-terminal cleavage/methylation domain-containing protein/prepilin-type processing-associated H-X9-DG protein